MSLLDQYLALTHTNVALAFFCYLDIDERPFSTLLLIKVRLKGRKCIHQFYLGTGAVRGEGAKSRRRWGEGALTFINNKG